MTEPADTSRRPGRPRSERARRAILRAAGGSAARRGHRPGQHGAVAERAGVSKATIYRWWPSKERLALDAMLEWAATGSSPRDTGSLRADLLSLVRPWVREIRRRPFGRVVAALVTAAQSDRGFAEEYRRHFVEQRRAPTRAAFERAIARGEVAADLDIEVALDLIYGPIYHRLLHGHEALTERFAGSVIDLALAGILPADDEPHLRPLATHSARPSPRPPAAADHRDRARHGYYVIDGRHRVSVARALGRQTSKRGSARPCEPQVTDRGNPC